MWFHLDEGSKGRLCSVGNDIRVEVGLSKGATLMVLKRVHVDLVKAYDTSTLWTESDFVKVAEVFHGTLTVEGFYNPHRVILHNDAKVVLLEDHKAQLPVEIIHEYD